MRSNQEAKRETPIVEKDQEIRFNFDFGKGDTKEEIKKPSAICAAFAVKQKDKELVSTAKPSALTHALNVFKK